MSAISCLDVAQAAKLGLGKPQGKRILYTCPRHEDRKPSLSIDRNGARWICGPCNVKGNYWDLSAFLARVAPDDKIGVTSWLRQTGLLARTGAGKTKRRVVAEYDYHDRYGTLLFQCVRFKPKGFKQRCPNGKGGWIWNLHNVSLVPYRLPELVEAEVVFIVEGEKDADNLVNIGFTATCSPMGAGNWRPEFSGYFNVGQSVVILPDNDELGRRLLTITENRAFLNTRRL